jgi:predicted nucleic acid-binding protein
MFLLDTNVVSELRKGGDGEADAKVIAWLSGVDAVSLYISAMTLIVTFRFFWRNVSAVFGVYFATAEPV